MFDKKGNLKEEFDIKINNSNGTNKKTVLSEDDVADYVVVVRKDGAFAVNKQTVINRSNGGGDGFSCTVKKDEITPLTGKLTANPIAPRNIGQGIDRIIRESLDNF
jgi:hypothetical protein